MRSAFLIAVVLVSACSAGADTKAPQADSDAQPLAIHASWPMQFATLAEVAASSDAVVIGRVADVAFDGPDPQDKSLPLTLYDFHVEKVIRGSAAENIIISQTGGTLNGRKSVVDGDPLMARGDHLVLYLNLVKTGPATGRYFIVGGPQGRLIEKDDGSLERVGNSDVGVPPGLTIASLVSSGGAPR